MIINHNMSAMNTYRQLSNVNSAQSSSMEKLSSGYRINRAGDDAAGLAISEKMRGQINGLDQASRNSQDAISLIQTAEGALDETESILQRMRELSVQSANDTNVDEDRTAIQDEIDQLSEEIDRIANTTEFNTRTLLNGASSLAATTQDSDAGDDATSLTILGGTGDTVVGAVFEFDTAAVATADSVAGANGGALGISDTLTADSEVTINGVSFAFTTTDTVEDVINTINDANIGATVSINAAGDNIDIVSDTEGSNSELSVTGLSGEFAAAGNLDISTTNATYTEGLDAQLAGGTASYTVEGNVVTVQDGDAKGLSFEISEAITDATDATTLTVTSNGGLNMQIGANEGQNMYISIGDMRAEALGVNAIDVTTASASESSITTIDDAITAVSAERSKLGAYQNRLEYTINNLDTSAENLQAAESRIRDVDMAEEMMEYSKNSILSQAATSMLAQANQSTQGVLSLLG